MIARIAKDRVANGLGRLLCLFILSLALLIAAGLYLRANPVFSAMSLMDLLGSVYWHPTQEKFGMASFIVGSMWVTGLAMVIAVPLGFLTALYLSEYAPARLQDASKPVIDVLAGISPVVYGVWGVAAIVPLVRDYLMPFLSENLPFFPFASDNYTGYSAMAGGLVLAVMVLPILIGVSWEVLSAVPFEIREVSLALGATKWETIKLTVLKKARPGLFAAVILAISRAFGETMAVLMVAGCNLHGLPRSIFDPAYPLPALIANTYGEMMSIPLYDAAVFLAALVLFAVTFVFNAIAWAILMRFEQE